MMADLLDIDAHGRVAPRSDQARRALADRAGCFALLPSAADLLVALRTPASGVPAPRPRCILAGDLSGFPLADFVAFVHQSRLSGVLTVAADGVERSIAFRDGEVRRARSTAAGERIGEVAVRLGYVTEAQLAVAMSGGRPLAKTLVEMGFLGANDLWKCFHEQVTEVFHALLLSRHGVFFLVDEDVPDRPGAPLAVNTQTLLMDGIRRIDELALFRARIPGPDAFLRRREPGRPVTLRPLERALLDLVDGRRSVAEIAREAHLNEFDATKILYHLAEAGQVEAVAGPAAPVDPAARAEAILAGMSGLLALVTAAVPADARTAFAASIRAHLADGSGPYAPLWREVVPAVDGTLDPAPVLRNLASLGTPVERELSGDARDRPADPGRLLFEALRELLLFHLFLAGERIACDADDALCAEVKRRLERLEELA